MSEGLAQGPYVVARVGFEPATSGRKAPNLPQRPSAFMSEDIFLLQIKQNLMMMSHHAP